MRILIVFGTRPEAIKMLPVVRALRARSVFEVVVAVTGQHREMLDQVFEAFEERPDIDLNLMEHDQSLPAITAKVVQQISKVIGTQQPDLVLVHGDTTTAMATALAGFYARVKIGHVEAGLRTCNLSCPWPEEFNRVVIDTVADFLFAPTKAAADNLTREYRATGRICVTGNTGIDALLHVVSKLDRQGKPRSDLFDAPIVLDPGRYLVLVTGHRRESFGAGFERICQSLAGIAKHPRVQIVYPVHLNPNVKTVVKCRLKDIPNIQLLDPVGYVDMVRLMRQARLILTDSGGIQEEGPALGRPVLVLRDTTERPEALSSGVVSLVGTDPARIIEEVVRLIDDDNYYLSRATAVFPYGDGTAAERIADILSQPLAP